MNACTNFMGMYPGVFFSMDQSGGLTDKTKQYLDGNTFSSLLHKDDYINLC